MRVGGSVAKLCLTLWNCMDCRLSGSSVHGILQARILEWVAIPFSRGSSQPRDRTHISCIGRWIFYLSHLVVWMRKTINSMHNKEVNYTVCYKVVSAMENIEQNKGMAGRIGVGCSFKQNGCYRPHWEHELCSQRDVSLAKSEESVSGWENSLTKSPNTWLWLLAWLVGLRNSKEASLAGVKWLRGIVRTRSKW